ncbi:hypothetical protein [Streptomyces sp. NPDC088775]|uniref:hypothetical protein n=1 Tax=Streptomyces sp. NPDC088775 TaxID=3365896 RepID=UPI003809D084
MLPPGAKGRALLVTGGNAGIGYFIAKQLSAIRATAVLGSQRFAKAAVATVSVCVSPVHGC